MDKKKATADSKLLDLLNQTLELEYTLLIHYPRIASAIQDADWVPFPLLISTW